MREAMWAAVMLFNVPFFASFKFVLMLRAGGPGGHLHHDVPVLRPLSMLRVARCLPVL